MSTADSIPGLVSVVIPVFNRPAMLREALDSVLDQTYRPVEVVIVDDGSTDETASVVQDLELANPGMVKSFRQDNCGPGSAREAGRRLARGEYLQFLDSDDLLLPRKLELQVESLRRRADASIAYGRTRVAHPDGRVEVSGRRSGERFEALFPTLLLGRIWYTETPLLRATICEAAGGWSTDLRLEEDWELESRLGALGAGLEFVSEDMSIHRHHLGKRAGSGEALDAARLKHQARAHLRILDNALASDRCIGSYELAQFSRALFFLARKCGRAGSGAEMRALLHASLRAARGAGISAWDVRLYAFLCDMVGVRTMNVIGTALWSQRFRSKGS